jgi:hypothetical protein
MADIIQQVKAKVKVIEGLRRDKAEQDGQKTQLFKQLKEVSGMTSIDTAIKKSEELSLELISHEDALKKLDCEMDAIILSATPQEN